MSVSFRSFAVESDGKIRRIPNARLWRLYEGATNPKAKPTAECIPEYAGSALRIADVAFERSDRGIEILSLSFHRIHFDATGRLDRERHHDYGRLVIEGMWETTPAQASDTVIDAEPRLRERRLRTDYRWTPSPAEREAVLEAFYRHILPKPPKPSRPRLRLLRGGVSAGRS